jgi:hypothetical protein
MGDQLLVGNARAEGQGVCTSAFSAVPIDRSVHVDVYDTRGELRNVAAKVF